MSFEYISSLKAIHSNLWLLLSSLLLLLSSSSLLLLLCVFHGLSDGKKNDAFTGTRQRLYCTPRKKLFLDQDIYYHNYTLHRLPEKNHPYPHLKEQYSLRYAKTRLWANGDSEGPDQSWSDQGFHCPLTESLGTTLPTIHVFKQK